MRIKDRNIDQIKQAVVTEFGITSNGRHCKTYLISNEDKPAKQVDLSRFCEFKTVFI